MDNTMEGEDGITASTHFIPRRPRTNADGSRQSKAPRPHSIGATIISNPKLVRGWQYYDNSSNPKSMKTFFSTINLPVLPSEESENGLRTGGNSNSRGNQVSTASNCLSEGGTEDVFGVEIKACIAEDDEQKSCVHNFLGVILTLISSTAFALTAVIVVHFSNPEDDKNYYGPNTLMLWMFQGLLLPSLLVLLCTWCFSAKRIFGTPSEGHVNNRKSIKWGVVPIVALIIVRALSGWLEMLLKMYSFSYISAPDTLTITCISPIFVLLAAWVCLKEKVGVIPVLTALIVIAGAGLITRPTFFTGQKSFNKAVFIGSSMAAGSLLLTIVSVITLRHLRRVHFSLVNFIFGAVGTGGALLFCVFDENFQFPRSGHHWMLAGAIVGLVFIGHSLMAVALKYEQAGIFTVVRTWEIPMSLLFNAVFFDGRLPDLLSAIGISLVVLGIVLIILRKSVETFANKSHKTHRVLRFFLI